jgi:hypothetical protein
VKKEYMCRVGVATLKFKKMQGGHAVNAEKLESIEVGEGKYY